jgi:hypothetical protein
MGLVVVFAAVGLVACDEGGNDGNDGDLVLDIGPEDPEAGKAMFDPTLPAGAKEDTVVGRKGPAVTVDRNNTAVWEVKNQWSDKTTAAAKLAGPAWAANSGLSWDEKFAAWVQSLGRSPSSYGSSTFTMTTPYGKTLPGPSLECAETAMFLRAAFASWYGLPFFMEGAHNGKRIFLGHFGFIYEDGTKYGTTPNFKTAYKDHSALATTWQSAGWPKDNTLRGRALGGSQDDFQPALFEGARAGAYFDELFLNKRVGYFMIILLSYYGSINLADPSNLFNIDPTAIRAGDPLVQRWQRQGIGHVYVTKKVEKINDETLSAELISGSMPRRQPVWETAASSQSSFTSDYSGGPGTNSDGQVYATLGGGLKRWRTPVNQGGRWTNVVPEADKNVFIDASNRVAIGARVETFRRILGTLSPQEQRDTLLGQIEAARQHLSRYPASCSARTRREQAFTKLYQLMADEFGLDKLAVDTHYRKLDDYVLAELTYNQSKTCCWNSSTSAMYEIVMDKAMVDTNNASSGTCQAPKVFMNENGGYEVFRAHAALLGRVAEWRAWTADETCPQSTVVSDTVAPTTMTGFCVIRDALDSEGPTNAPGHDAFEPNETAANASVQALPVNLEGQIANGDVDFFAVTAPGTGKLTVELAFTHSEGDLDLEVQNNSGATIGSSAGTGNTETAGVNVTAGRVVIKVMLYGGTNRAQKYTLKVTFAGGTTTTALSPDRFEPNDALTQVANIVMGVTDNLTMCGDLDVFAVDVTAREVTAKVEFKNSEGDLDVRLYDAAGTVVGTSDGTGDVETITKAVTPGRYRVEVQRYGTRTNTCQAYKLTLSQR